MLLYTLEPAEVKGVNVEQEAPEDDFSGPEHPGEELNLSEIIDITVNTIPNGMYECGSAVHTSHGLTCLHEAVRDFLVTNLLVVLLQTPACPRVWC